MIELLKFNKFGDFITCLFKVHDFLIRFRNYKNYLHFSMFDNIEIDDEIESEKITPFLRNHFEKLNNIKDETEFLKTFINLCDKL